MQIHLFCLLICALNFVVQTCSRVSRDVLYPIPGILD